MPVLCAPLLKPRSSTHFHDGDRGGAAYDHAVMHGLPRPGGHPESPAPGQKRHQRGCRAAHQRKPGTRIRLRADGKRPFPGPRPQRRRREQRAHGHRRVWSSASVSRRRGKWGMITKRMHFGSFTRLRVPEPLGLSKTGGKGGRTPLPPLHKHALPVVHVRATPDNDVKIFSLNVTFFVNALAGY